jgi:O-antigen/teichoic acid export membrane protein
LNFAITGGIFQLSSKYNNSRPILNLYIIFLAIQFLIILLIMLFINVFNFTQDIFSSDNIYLIIFIGIIEFINFVFIFLLSYGDAKGLTVEFQKIKTYELASRGLLLIFIYYIDLLTLYSFLTITFSLSIISNLILLKKLSFIKNFTIQKERKIIFAKKVMKYSLPLAMVEVIAVFYNMADMFLIQTMLGSETFAVYIYAYKFVMIILIFIQPMFNIFWHYIAKNFKEHIEKIQIIFNELFIIIYTLSVMFMLFLFNFSEDIILLFTDERYIKSAEYLSILSIITIPLAIEKLAVVILYSTENTKQYRNIVLTGSILSILGSLGIFALYKFNIISAENLIWIIMLKIIIYSYILNGYILKSAMDILKINFLVLLKRIVIITFILFVSNIHLYIFNFNSIYTFILFSIVNICIIGFMLYSFKSRINNIEISRIVNEY